MSGLSTGGIVGIVLGVLLFIALLVAALLCVYKISKYIKEKQLPPDEGNSKTVPEKYCSFPKIDQKVVDMPESLRKEALALQDKITDYTKSRVGVRPYILKRLKNQQETKKLFTEFYHDFEHMKALVVHSAYTIPPEDKQVADAEYIKAFGTFGVALNCFAILYDFVGEKPENLGEDSDFSALCADVHNAIHRMSESAPRSIIPKLRAYFCSQEEYDLSSDEERERFDKIASTVMVLILTISSAVNEVMIASSNTEVTIAKGKFTLACYGCMTQIDLLIENSGKIQDASVRKRLNEVQTRLSDSIIKHRNFLQEEFITKKVFPDVAETTEKLLAYEKQGGPKVTLAMNPSIIALGEENSLVGDKVSDAHMGVSHMACLLDKHIPAAKCPKLHKMLSEKTLPMLLYLIEETAISNHTASNHELTLLGERVQLDERIISAYESHLISMDKNEGIKEVIDNLRASSQYNYLLFSIEELPEDKQQQTMLNVYNIIAELDKKRGDCGKVSSLGHVSTELIIFLFIELDIHLGILKNEQSDFAEELKTLDVQDRLALHNGIKEIIAASASCMHGILKKDFMQALIPYEKKGLIPETTMDVAIDEPSMDDLSKGRE